MNSERSINFSLTKEDLKIDELEVTELTKTEEGYIFITEPKHKMAYCPLCNSENIICCGKTKRNIQDFVSVMAESINEKTKLKQPIQKKVPVIIQIWGHRYECKNCQKKFPEHYSFVGKGEDITKRFKKLIQKESLVLPFHQIKTEYGVSESTASNYFLESIKSKDANREWIAPGIITLCQVDLVRFQLPLVIDGRKGEILEIPLQNEKRDIENVLSNLSYKHRIKIAIISMHSIYKDAIEAVFPNTPIIVNQYFCEREMNCILSLIQDVIKNKLTPQEAKKLDFAFKLMFSSEDVLTDSNKATRKDIFQRYPEIESTYEVTKRLKDIYKLTSYNDATEAYDLWLSDLAEWESCAKLWVLNSEALSKILYTVNLYEAWRAEILAFWQYKIINKQEDIDNSATLNELINTLIKNGRTYTYEVVRGKLLYGSKATRRPEYAKPNINYNAMSMITSLPEPTLTRGFSVDMSELIECMKNDPDFIS